LADRRPCGYKDAARVAVSPLDRNRGAAMMNTKCIGRIGIVVSAALALAAMAAPHAQAKGPGKAVMTPVADVKWADAGFPGVSIAAVDGDTKKGASHFFLKYAAGFVSPPHHHSPDHHVVTVSGTLVLTAGGKEVRLAPGSYFAFKDKAAHVARCEGTQDCVMFVDARGRWDVVPTK
jgi:quercetin dioxygenase-like cupin family protein